MSSKSTPSSNQVSIGGEVAPPIFENNLEDDFFFDIDSAFEQIQMGDEVTPPTQKAAKKTRAKTPKKKAKKAIEKTQTLAQNDIGMEQMRETYRELVRLNLSPVARYLKAFEFGVNTKDLTQIAQWVVTPLITKAKDIGLDTETTALNSFKRVLARVNRSEGTRLNEKESKNVIKAFESLSDTFGLYFRGHSTAVVNLIFFYRSLKRKDHCNETDLRKLFSIGIPSMTMIRKISLAELISLTGLAKDKASWIRNQARSFTMYDFV